jgi:hypothetical protein
MDNKLSNKVKIVIPLYKSDLNEQEQLALSQCCKILARYPICMAKPKSLDVSSLIEQYPMVEVENFSDGYFKNKESYNQLMLSSGFYERFLAYDYILIHQLDAFVFKDELEYWCNKGFDYIGAPWIINPEHTRIHYKFFSLLKYRYYKIINKPFKQKIIGGKVGNGGFSLRKVFEFYTVTLLYRFKTIPYLYQSKSKDIFNEDVFWAIENPGFKYPVLSEALLFSIDHYPEACLKMNHNVLPFGCHGWSKPRKWIFWKPIINKHIV